MHVHHVMSAAGSCLNRLLCYRSQLIAAPSFSFLFFLLSQYQLPSPQQICEVFVCYTVSQWPPILVPHFRLLQMHKQTGGRRRFGVASSTYRLCCSAIYSSDTTSQVEGNLCDFYSVRGACTCFRSSYDSDMFVFSEKSKVHGDRVTFSCCVSFDI